MTERHGRRVETQGFTLIELLVVVAIIAVLAALIFPVFARAKVSAKDKTCINNLAQYDHTLAMYGADNEDRLPCSTDVSLSVSGPAEPTLTQDLAPYGATAEMKRCPLDQYYLDPEQDFAIDPSRTFWQVLGTSYRYRNAFGLKGLPLSGIPKPTETLLMGDLWHFHDGDPTISGKFQVLYADGHIQLTDWDKLSELTPDF